MTPIFVRWTPASSSMPRARRRRRSTSPRCKSGSSGRALKILEVGRQADHLWFASELITGPTLTEVVARSGRLPLDRALRTALDVGEALAEAAKLGVIHRDVA